MEVGVARTMELAMAIEVVVVVTLLEVLVSAIAVKCVVVLLLGSLFSRVTQAAGAAIIAD